MRGWPSRRRELQAVTDAAPQGQWCWAAQAAGALTAMQQLLSEAIRHGQYAPEPAALAAQIRLFRSAGARQFCAIRSYLSTAAKHGLGLLDALVMLTQGRPWIPVTA